MQHTGEGFRRFLKHKARCQFRPCHGDGNDNDDDDDDDDGDDRYNNDRSK